VYGQTVEHLVEYATIVGTAAEFSEDKVKEDEVTEGSVSKELLGVTRNEGEDKSRP
jgi:hypothetical protein